MQTEKILKQLDLIDKMVSQTRDLLFCPEGIRITILHRDEYSVIEYWDGKQTPSAHEFTWHGEPLINSVMGVLYHKLTNMSLTDIEDKVRVKEVLSDINLDDIPMDVKEAMVEVGINVFNKIDDEEHKELIKQMEKKYAPFNNKQGLKEIQESDSSVL